MNPTKANQPIGLIQHTDRPQHHPFLIQFVVRTSENLNAWAAVYLTDWHKSLKRRNLVNPRALGRVIV